MSWKQRAIALRNRLSPTNSFRIDRRCAFQSNANILSTRINVEGHSQVLLGQGVRLRAAELLVRGSNNVLIMGEGSSFSGRIELLGENNTVRIGRNTAIGGALLVAHHGRRIEIGTDCLFSGGIELRTTDSHKIFAADGQRINADADIVVGDRVWMGAGVIVLKGVTVGAGSVVGMRSIVTKSLQDSSLAVGSPARVIETGISWRA